jgi:hypothetical protein
MRPKHTTLTPHELEIMNLVWQRRNATVRNIYETLLKHRKIAYTTVMTMMNILETKGYLKKRRQNRAFVYRPAHAKNKIIGRHDPRIYRPRIQRFPGGFPRPFGEIAALPSRGFAKIVCSLDEA